MNNENNLATLPPISTSEHLSKEEEEEDEKQETPLGVSSAHEPQAHSVSLKEGGQNDNVEEVKDDVYYERLQKEKLEEELAHLGKDNWFTKFIVQKTWIVVLATIVFAIVMTVTCIALGGFELSDEHDRDYMVWDSIQMKNWDMLELSKEAVQTNYAGGIQPLRTTSIDKWTTSITFECKNCSTILTADYIKEMYAVEQAIISDANFANFCLAVSSTDSSCDMSRSYYSFSKNFASNINTLTQADVDTYLANIRASESLYFQNNVFMETQFTQNNTISQKARAIYVFAGPIEIDGKRWKTYTDDEAGQEEKMADFSLDLEKRFKTVNTSLKVQLYNRAWANYKEAETTINDFSLIIVSFTFVFIYVSFHLKSIFLASCAMAAIAFSYPISICLTRFVFQISFFQSLNLVAVFVILGISADNVFVFTDAWQQSGTYSPLNPDDEDRHNNFQPRMNYTWKKATKAISTTSLTTAIAFLATGFSKIMPISAFGYFASTLVIVNYLFAIVTFPACLIIFERYLSDKCRYRKFIGDVCTRMINKCRKPKVPRTHNQSESSEHVENDNVEQIRANMSQQNDGGEEEQDLEQQERIVRKQSKAEELPEHEHNTLNSERGIEYFFRVYWNNWINKAKIIILVFVGIWAVLAIWRITQFEPATEVIQMLPDSHYVTKLTNSLRNDYNTGENDNTIQISFVWGVKGINKDGVSSWDAADRGKIIWDDTFDMSSPTNQQRILTICDDLLNSSLVKDKKVTCWVKDFLIYASGSNPPTTISQSSFYTQLQAYLATTEGQNYYNDNSIGYLNGTLYFMRIEALAVQKPFQGYEKTNPVYNQWEDLKDNYNKASQTGVNNVIQTGEFHWAYLATEKEFANGAITGTAMSLSFAFVVLIISTLNIITATYAIASITGIVISVVAFMEILGWTLGILESLAIVILIGFSVDYVVHLANHYVESVYEDRYRRMEEALSSMGISIFSGAITTIGSGVFLFLATLVFFTQFAVLILSTILFSLFFALVFFTALNHLIGPQRNQGNMKYYVTDPAIKWTKKKLDGCFRKQEADGSQPPQDAESHNDQ
ncbi:unnamed protein product [Moneuplotes crassus]|uniref:SSD domain-containing protein n=1 Tax=Euplotes crassus TaxID=5936 RepID=A0AAD1X6S1_EUPCR|nr:unnamed protein product [Moneuplotes crassus]